jgi:hypothetical protein
MAAKKKAAKRITVIRPIADDGHDQLCIVRDILELVGVKVPLIELIDRTKREVLVAEHWAALEYAHESGVKVTRMSKPLWLPQASLFKKQPAKRKK